MSFLQGHTRQPPPPPPTDLTTHWRKTLNQFTMNLKSINLVMAVFSCDQAALWMVQSVRPSVRRFWLCSHHRIIMKFSGVITNNRSDVHAKGQGQRSNFNVTRLKKSSILTQIGCFRTATLVWIHSLMAMKWCTNLKQHRRGVFQGHPSNFKATRDKKLPILIPIERFRTVTPV